MDFLYIISLNKLVAILTRAKCQNVNMIDTVLFTPEILIGSGAVSLPSLSAILPSFKTTQTQNEGNIAVCRSINGQANLSTGTNRSVVSDNELERDTDAIKRQYCGWFNCI